MDLSLWLLVGASALLLRTGLALYLSGISRCKNAASAMFRTIIEICLAFLAYWAFGAAIRDGSFQEIFGWKISLGVSDLFAAGLMLIVPAVILGATLERSTILPTLIATLLMCGLVTPLAWGLAANPTGWLSRHGFIDLGGASFIHLSAGLAAAVAAHALGPRQGKYNRDGSTNVFLGHDSVAASVGLLLILVAWAPCIIGCGIMSGHFPESPAVFNILLAGASGGGAGMFYSYIRYNRFDPLLIYASLLGGLVSITASGGQLPGAFAAATGAVAGILIPWAIVQIDLVWKIDDPAGGIAIFGVGGLWSLLSAAIFVPATFGQHLYHLLIQSVGSAVIGLISIGCSAAVFLPMRSLAKIRVVEAAEFEGLDLAEHDLNAYPDFQQTTIKSYQLREM